MTDTPENQSNTHEDPELTSSEVSEEIPQFNEGINLHVASCMETIDGCSDLERKHYYALTEYAQRQIAIQLADLWGEARKVAKKNSCEGEKPESINISVKIKADMTNLLALNAKVATGFSEKHAQESIKVDDLRQLRLWRQDETFDPEAAEREEQESEGDDNENGRPTEKEVQRMSKGELVALAEREEVEIPEKAKKPEIISAILSAWEARDTYNESEPPVGQDETLDENEQNSAGDGDSNTAVPFPERQAANG